MMVLLVGCSKSDESNTTDTTSESSKTSPADVNWYDDAVFVGDSVTLKLSYYCDANPDALDNARFFCAGSLGYTSALWDLYQENAVHPYYKGQIELAENCAVATGANNVLIMLVTV